MLPLKLVRSLVLGDAINSNLHHNDHGNHGNGNSIEIHPPKTPKSKTPLLLFLPTKELVADTYRLATIARDMGMDLYPTPSLSHIIFSCPSSPPPSSSISPASTSSSFLSSFPSSSWSSASSSWSSLPENSVPLPFPSLASSAISHLRSFVALSKGLFKLVFVSSNYAQNDPIPDNTKIWNCCSISLFSRLTGFRIDSMDGFSRTLAGMGWTLFKTNQNPSPDSGGIRVRGGNSVYLFRKVEANRVRASRGKGDGGGGGRSTIGECRIRELRLPALDFRNAPLRILQYILLMTDDIFYLA